ncbi:hypothetical protein EVAR_26507_1 [Eumeta japonica]|uniref:Uncharacterized protein n=1 Tax=Eumeta variegata TaxID=151549 RepID=A0A4C1V9F3_EUMVA|nr:hypothetical protein EVAR_26507_1 [Eumeta japonica]
MRLATDDTIEQYGANTKQNNYICPSPRPDFHTPLSGIDHWPQESYLLSGRWEPLKVHSHTTLGRNAVVGRAVVARVSLVLNGGALNFTIYISKSKTSSEDVPKDQEGQLAISVYVRYLGTIDKRACKSPNILWWLVARHARGNGDRECSWATWSPLPMDTPDPSGVTIALPATRLDIKPESVWNWYVHRPRDPEPLSPRKPPRADEAPAFLRVRWYTPIFAMACLMF